MKEATHEITACYFPGKDEVELTWEDVETHEKAALTAKVTPEVGHQIAKVVMPCVCQNAVAKELDWKTVETLILASLSGNGMDDRRVTPPFVTGLVLPYNNADQGVGDCLKLTIPVGFADSICEFVNQHMRFPQIKITLELAP